MSRRSYGSIRSQRNRFTDEDVFNYVLRTAYLAYLMQPKAVEPPSSNATNRDSHYGESKEREYVTRVQNAVTNSIISIGDLFKDVGGGPKSVKYPEKLLKILEQKLQNIAMGKDSAYSDQLIRRTIAVFYGTFTTDSFKRQMKDSRKIEDLILMFVTTSTGVLKKDPSLSGDGWKVELNNQIAQFVGILRDSVKQVSHTPELAARLDMYASKLAPSQTVSDSGYDTASASSRDRDSYIPSTLSVKISDMPLVLSVANLFNLENEDVQKEVNQLKKYCTEAAALTDLKTCLKNINAGTPFPGRKEDFDSDAAWQQWRTTETSTLSQLMLVMVQFNPELAKSAPSDVLPSAGRPDSVYSISSPESPRPSQSSRHGSISSRYSISMTQDALISNDPDAVSDAIDGDDDVPVGHHFTFIPPNPRKFYKRLVEICVKADLEAMAELQDDQEVSLGILSAHHLELINECAVRWRIGQPYRVTCFMDVIKYKYEREEVPLECIPESLTMIQRALHELELSKWPRSDQEYIASVYGSLFNIFLSHLYHALEAIPNLKESEVGPYLVVLEQVRDSGLLEQFEVDITSRLSDLQERVRTVAIHHYTEKMNDLQAAPGVNRALPLLLMTDVLEKNAKTLDKRFPEPILGQLDLVALVVEAQVPLFFGDLEGSRKRLYEGANNGPTPDVPVEDIFALYRRTKTLMGMFQSFCPNAHTDFDLLMFFEPYVRQWLVSMDGKTTQWVQAAVAADKFQSEGDEKGSSSIIDLFDSLRSPISFLQDLEWVDEYQEARFFTSLAKSISKGVDQYCRSIEELFMTEMFPRITEYIQPQKSSAWIEKARQLAITGEKKIEPFNFQPESCVKLNNIDAARKLLDKLYEQMEVDKVTTVLEAAPPVPEKVENPKFLFTVKIVMAEGLVPLDSSPSSKLDTFVTLSDQDGNRMAKTRTIYETLQPRWEETFDISVEKALWLMISIRDRALVGKHDTVGRAYICLDPRRFGDLLNHDLWLDLDSQGRVLLRVSMEGEKDDVQFYFGRAFRSLKRAEADMVRIFIDKMTPFIQQSLSRSVVKSLVKTGTSIDYNKALGGVTALYQQALGRSSNEIQIPLPQAEKPRIRPGELTDVEIEAAIVPLFDYFDANLQTLNTYLSDMTKEMVMTRLWKEILTVIESLLIPPLSDVGSDLKPLSDKEVDIVFKWLKFLRDYFYAGGEGPVPLESLQNPKYDNVVKIRFYYDWETDALMEECVRMMQQNLRAAPSVKKRAKSVYSQRNLGTIKDRKREKRQQKDTASGDTDTIMRILRMRPHTTEFIAQQLQIMTRVRAEQEQQARETQQRKEARRQVVMEQESEIPLPPVPE